MLFAACAPKAAPAEATPAPTAAYPSDWNDPPEFDGLTFPTEAEGKVLTIYQRKANAGVKFRDVDVAIPDWRE